jgi:hypothetical protein
MSTALSEPKLTSTVGYYNGNKWPIHLVISELGVTLHLKAGEFILDKLSRKINDPFFDKYAKPLQLSKEVSRNGQVPLIVIPPITPATLADRPAHSVTAVTKFTADRRPIMPTPKPVPALAVNTPTHKGMSIEQARELGFIGGAVREVPEDYGVTDTSGRPVDAQSAPPIKYAMESTPRIRQSETLPEGLTQMDDKVDPSQIATRQSLVGSMQKAASATGIVDSPTGFMNQATMHAPPPQPILAPSGQPAAAALQEAEEALPQPNIFAPGQVSQPAHAVPAKGVPDLLADARKQAAKAPSSKDSKPFVCNIDGKDFRWRSQLEGYAKRKFPDKIAEILAPYPETE